MFEDILAIFQPPIWPECFSFWSFSHSFRKIRLILFYFFRQVSNWKEMSERSHKVAHFMRVENIKSKCKTMKLIAQPNRIVLSYVCVCVQCNNYQNQQPINRRISVENRTKSLCFWLSSLCRSLSELNEGRKNPSKNKSLWEMCTSFSVNIMQAVCLMRIAHGTCEHRQSICRDSDANQWVNVKEQKRGNIHKKTVWEWSSRKKWANEPKMERVTSSYNWAG